MSLNEPIAARRFSMLDQRNFAELSGDCNPMHIDPLAARRTPAGAPAVHGIHALLWALETVATSCKLRSPASLEVQFEKFILTECEVLVFVRTDSETELRLEVRTGETVCSVVKLKADLASVESISFNSAGQSNIEDPLQQPLELSFTQMAELRGKFKPPAKEADIAAAFPAVAAWLSSGVIADLANLSYLVGMICPGMHSIFSGIAVRLVTSEHASSEMHYAVIRTDERFRIGTIQVGGSGVEGFIEAYMRPAPVTQPRAAELRPLVAPDEFCSSNALIIGGPRGLGELTAKLLAAGGATVILTYAVGAADAETVVAEITETGGKARAIRFQVGASVQEQLRDLPPAIDRVYYFASPRISRQDSGLFDSSRF